MGGGCRNSDMVNARHCLFCDLWNVPEKNVFCFVFCLMPLDPDLGFFGCTVIERILNAIIFTWL